MLWDVTRDELCGRLDANGVHADAYDFDKTQKDEVYTLEKHPAGWTVYYRERGLRRDERTFTSEHDASSFFRSPGSDHSVTTVTARPPG